MKAACGRKYPKISGLGSVTMSEPEGKVNPRGMILSIPVLIMIACLILIGAPARKAYANDIVVNSTADNATAGDGHCTLREAINNANAEYDTTSGDCAVGSWGIGANGVTDTITFDSTVFTGGQKIILTDILPHILENLTITGPGADKLTIDGGGYLQAFVLDYPFAIVSISGLTISNCSTVIDNDGAITTVTNCNISGNGNKYASTFGAVENWEGTLTMTNCTVSDNTVEPAIWNKGTLIMTNCTVSGNSSGGINNSGSASGTITMTNCTVSGNSGGGLNSFSSGPGTITMTNCTVSGNSGGGVNNTAGQTITMTNCTVSGNPDGGVNNSSGTVNLRNTILANSLSGDDCTNSGTINAQNSLIEDGLSCVNGTNSNNLTGAPKLDALSDNGGPTETMALEPGSPAIDAGDNNLAVDADSNPLIYDQRGEGYDRIVNGTVDIGAYERKADQTITVTKHAPARRASDSESFDVAATASSGLPVAITVTGSCSGSGTGTATITMTRGTGTCTVYYDQSGDGEYSAAPEVVDAVNAQREDQVPLTLNAGSPLADGSTETLSTGGGSGNGAVTYQVTSGDCTVSGDQLTANSGTGTCSITATKAGDADYMPATSSGTVTLEKSGQTITVTKDAPARASDSESFDVAATASSGLPVAISVTGSCSGSGTGTATITMTNGTGDCTVHYNQSGDDHYDAAPEVTEVTETSYPSHVVIPDARGNGNITLDTVSPGCGFTAYSAETEAEVGSDPSYNYPYGLVSFRLDCPEADVTITFPGSISGTTYRKYGPTTPGDSTTTAWYDFSDVTINSSTSITLHLRDGQKGDDTGVDGTIVDAGGAGQQVEKGAVPVPTMDGWGMIIFMLLAGICAAYYLRRRKARA